MAKNVNKQKSPKLINQQSLTVDFLGRLDLDKFDIKKCR